MFVCGLCGMMDLKTTDGQKLGMGKWLSIRETAWVLVEIGSLTVKAQTWYRDGNTIVPVVIGKLAAYVLQKPCAQYRSCWESITILKDNAFADLDVTSEEMLPSWAKASIWRTVTKSGHKRRASTEIAPDSHRQEARLSLPEPTNAGSTLASTPGAQNILMSASNTQTTPAPDPEAGASNAEGGDEDGKYSPDPTYSQLDTPDEISVAGTEGSQTPPAEYNAVFARR
ncbi:hypothetical protein FRC11_009009 [Ceratobasidium sp. 423]|nr:hypothetical protein FRC11_009009 [Ceratobasidium sp. 423]